MITNILRATAALLGAIILSATLAGKPALAQLGAIDDDCPCFTSALIDGWFSELGPSRKLRAGQLLACAYEASLMTFDYFDGQASDSSIDTQFLIDVMERDGSSGWRCLLDVKADNLDGLSPPGPTQIDVDITSGEASGCRAAILLSSAWSNFGCPNNQ